MSKLINFIQILVNNEKSIDDYIVENTKKLLESDDIDNSYKISNELLNTINDYNIIIEHKLEDPIMYIENFFFEKNKCIDNNYQCYKILSYDFVIDNKNILYIMFINLNYNNTIAIANMTDDDIKNNINLLGSNLVKNYNNSLSIFGDIFIIGVDKEYYLEYNSVDNNSNNKLVKKYDNIYYNFTLRNLIDSFMNINYVKIFIKPQNNIYVYKREIIESYIIENNYEIIKEYNIIKCKHNDIYLYIKFVDTLIDSYNYIINMTNKDIKHNNFYFISISKNDINYLLSK